MAVSPIARARAQAAALTNVRAQKTTYAERLRRILDAARPPLAASELSLGLDLDEREVGRFLSTSPRMASARPDGELRALIDAILGGTLMVAVRAGPPGARREVVVVDPVETRRLDRTWTLLPLAAEVGLRDHELDEAALWDLGVGRTRPVADGPIQNLCPEGRLFLGQPRFPVALGAMRLSTIGRPEDGEAVLRAARSEGVQIFDTADSYALDEEELGHNERLLARVFGRSDKIVIVTKAGLRRPGGRWVPDASPARLRSSCEASLRNLGVDALPLFLLHVVDPRVPFAESVGALAELRAEGKVREVGLCNVTPAQVDEARAIVPIAAVQAELSRRSPANLPLVAHCEALGIPFMAHRPLGGHARAGQPWDPAVVEVAHRWNVPPERIALAWLCTTGPNVIPVVGATRVASAMEIGPVAGLVLSERALAELDRGLPPRVHGDAIVLLAGPPASGKTGRVGTYVDRGFARLNRDERGGTLAGLVPPLRDGLAQGRRRWILDNTFPTRESRRAFVEAGREAGVPVHCLTVRIELGDALQNAVLRMLDRRGRLLSPEEMKAETDPNLFPPLAIHRWFQTAEPATLAEGFARVEEIPFVRRPGGTQRALLLDLDGTVRRTTTGAPYPRHPDEVELLPGRAETLRRYHDEGWLLLGVSNQSGIARGDVDAATVAACFARTEALLGVPLPVRWCPHPAGAIRCWCRKPMPGLALTWIVEHDLNRAACRFVGDMATDRECAGYLGVPYIDADEFFAGPSS